MSIFRLAALAVCLLSAAEPAFAADLGYGHARGGPANCVIMQRSEIVDYGPAEIRTEMEKRYDDALATSQSERVLHHRGGLYTWALDAKVACGRAIGYLDGREVNVLMISKCDCFHRRMKYSARF